VKQWEIWEFPFPSADQPHMFVVLSPTRLCADVSFDSINGLLCTTVRPVGRPAKAHEVFLDPSDGLDWTTSVRCNVVFHFAKAAAGARRGLVSTIRRREISRRLNASMELPT